MATAKTNFGKAKLKNHVTPNAPGIFEAMANLCGVSLELFMNACSGDTDAIRETTDMGRLAKTYEENLPQALENFLRIIKVTGDFNKALAQVATQVRVSGTQILDAGYKGSLEETRMANNIVELRDRQTNAVTAEARRHVHATSLIAIEASTAELMAVTEYQVNLMRIEDKIPQAQQRADEAYRNSVNRAVWQRGSEADLSRIRRPDYKKNQYGLGAIFRNFGGGGWWNGFKRAMGL